MTLNVAVHNRFKDAFEQRCCRLIIEAYNTSIKEKIIQLDWNENDISAEIIKCANENPLRKKWRFFISSEAPIPKYIPKEKGFANKFPRIDIKFATFRQQDEYEYFFEAKNLKQGDSALKRRYIKTGIDSFVSGKYVNGSLVIYLLEGKAEEAIDSVNSLLIKDHREMEILCSHSYKCLDTFYQSNHPNIGILKHLLLDFTRI